MKDPPIQIDVSSFSVNMNSESGKKSKAPARPPPPKPKHGILRKSLPVTKDEPSGPVVYTITPARHSLCNFNLPLKKQGLCASWLHQCRLELAISEPIFVPHKRPRSRTNRVWLTRSIIGGAVLLLLLGTLMMILALSNHHATSI